MIEALDHIVVSDAAPERAVSDCELVLGRRAEQGAIRLGNTRLVVRAAAGEPGLASLAFATADLAKAQSLLERRGLPATREAGGLRIAPAATHGVPMALGPLRTSAALEPSALLDAEPAAAVSGLDHVVIRTPDPERAVALY